MCAACHKAEVSAWSGSHHAAATVTDPMQFLGDFAASPAHDRGISVVWHKDGGSVTATLEGKTVPVRSALGIYPLQQYLADMPGGKRQVLPLAWDARPALQGGQRWFNPAREGAPDWTSRDQTWNFMCVDCHATGVAKNYDLAGDSYHTTMAEAHVGCAACHGDMAAHLALARAGTKPGVAGTALGVVLPASSGHWGAYDPATGIRHWVGPARTGAELHVCAPCHARRRKLLEGPHVGSPFLDGYEPSLATPGLYQADGQNLDEVFEYGSFLQSRMFQNGVTCSDCHDPHSGKTRLDGNALCGQCHDPVRFDTVSHTHHGRDSEAARCVTCHMPTRTYMGVHVRHDHGLRVPRPDISALAGTSDVCTTCHTGRGDAWAEAAIKAWRGASPAPRAGAADALVAGHDDHARATALSADISLPPIVRATLLSEADGTSAQAVAAATDPNPLLRLAATNTLALPEEAEILARLAHDPVRAVRIAAARRVPDLPDAASALAEWRAAEEASADRPDAHLNLGALLADEGKMQSAAVEWHTALRLDGHFAPALIDLADLSRARGDEVAAEHLLREAVTADSMDAEAWYALTLALIRQHRLREASDSIAHAVRLKPGDRQYARVQALLGSE